MRSDRERERESNSIFSFVEETKTRLILSRQMDNSSEDILLARWRKLATRRGGDENLSIGFSINRYQRNRFGEKYSDKAIMVLFYSVVHCSLLPFRGRKRVCTCVKLISLKQTVRFIRRASYLLKYCSPSPFATDYTAASSNRDSMIFHRHISAISAFEPGTRGKCYFRVK